MSVEVVASVDDAASVLDALSSDGGGGGGGGAIAALVSPEAADAASVADAVADVSEGGGGGGGIIDPSLSPICSWSDISADCKSSPSEEKALVDDTVPVVEPLS